MDSNNKMGVNAAILRDVYATDDRPAAVFAHYRHHLGADWVEDVDLGPRLTQWRDSVGWESDKYVMLIGIRPATSRRAARGARGWAGYGVGVRARVT